MKVKVTPPYEGAGSFEVDAEKAGKYYWTVKGERLEGAWCEEIPSITPEPGDICQAYINDGLFVVDKVAEGKCFERDWYWPIGDVRVLARKLPDWEKAKDAAWNFRNEITDVPRDKEKAAYERFLADILGVPYARVE